MPILISGGDSFTWGRELPDQINENPSKLTWASLLAQKLNREYICTAKPGGANNTITRKVIKEISYHKNEDIAVVVMWTYTHRNEIRLRNCYPYNTIVHDVEYKKNFEIDDYFINFNAWHGLSFEEKMSFFSKNVDEGTRKFFQLQHEKLTELGITTAANEFYKVTGDAISHHHNTLKDIILLQFYLEKRNIPYIFCSATTELFDKQPPQIYECGLWDEINWNNWYKEDGFHVWSQKNNYEFCGNHPGLEAHQDWFNLIMPKISAIF